MTWTAPIFLASIPHNSLECLRVNRHSPSGHQVCKYDLVHGTNDVGEDYYIMITEHATEWLGFPVKLYDSKTSETGVTDYANTVYRIALDWDADIDFPTLFSKFVSNPAAAKTAAIIIGQFHGDDPSQGLGEVVQSLVSAQAKLPNLRGIFIGDILSEENEISWIVQSDVFPLLEAYPQLEHLRLRGTSKLSLGGGFAHGNLKSLVIETGGLPPALLEEVLASELPALELLELWLGTPSYGGDVTVEDLAPLFSGKLFPALNHLGLRDSEIVNDIAAALASAPIISRLSLLDLSLGTLGDAGGQALLDNPDLKRLKHLDLHRHFLSEEMMSALKLAFPSVNLDDPQGDDTSEDDRYAAVGE